MQEKRKVKNKCPVKTKINHDFLWKSEWKIIKNLYMKCIDISFLVRYYRGSF